MHHRCSLCTVTILMVFAAVMEMVGNRRCLNASQVQPVYSYNSHGVCYTTVMETVGNRRCLSASHVQPVYSYNSQFLMVFATVMETVGNRRCLSASQVQPVYSYNSHGVCYSDGDSR